ncbi:hypothetical protein P7K49_040769 [Saguinus oedipus]|uniref:Uncharacterized protein n=1 Tax=Saguinus oedipus TaxID=9490 RepID=A0ABQ9TDF8_SAGOE|nr:hypothetical protein P7K49_040758 [Saguinus oedipus]KAK2082596.1 hypothetical protein P7K49_040769 [Saguinus oedipus]
MERESPSRSPLPTRQETCASSRHTWGSAEGCGSMSPSLRCTEHRLEEEGAQNAIWTQVLPYDRGLVVSGFCVGSATPSTDNAAQGKEA